MPLPMTGMPMRMIMLNGNAFGVFVTQQGPRGRDAWTGPDMIMTDAGTSVGDRQYLNIDLMTTFERWTFPQRGYPLLLQIGETDENGVPFIDGQHPHNSPIMGLTLSDTIKLDTGGEKDHLKLFFAPRGESTDGPIAFMHRTTGMVNPDAPLGHHVGQDVGHITSTVIGASIKLHDFRIEASTFNGEEPEPTKVDLPLGTPNSYALRLTKEFNPSITAMASAAYVKNPEPDDPSLAFVTRYSASLYSQNPIGQWRFFNSLIFGMITKYDHAPLLLSLGEEFLFRSPGGSQIFGRVETLQRTPEELAIESTDPNSGNWILATTLGYSQVLYRLDGAELALGGSVTQDFLPSEYKASYGGDPWSGKVFLQLNGLKMWNY
jgi:hypothetical protein